MPGLSQRRASWLAPVQVGDDGPRDSISGSGKLRVGDITLSNDGVEVEPCTLSDAVLSSSDASPGVVTTPLTEVRGASGCAAETSVVGDLTPRLSDSVNSNPGAIDWNCLRKGRIIGRGGGGMVRQMKNSRTKEILAVKRIDVSDASNRQHVYQEIALMIKFGDAPSLVRCFGVRYLEGSVEIAMEYMDGGSLGDLIKRSGAVPEPCLGSIMLGALLGLNHLHQHHIIHRDLKPQNLLLSRRGECKLSDFGCVEHIGDGGSSHAFVGTMNYMAPERIEGQTYSFESDIWGVGITLLEAAMGHFPFTQAKGYWGIMQALSADAMPSLPLYRFSSELAQFAESCLQKDPAKRPSAEALLAHAFLQRAAAHRAREQLLHEYLHETCPVSPQAARFSSRFSRMSKSSRVSRVSRGRISRRHKHSAENLHGHNGQPSFKARYEGGVGRPSNASISSQSMHTAERSDQRERSDVTLRTAGSSISGASSYRTSALPRDGSPSSASIDSRWRSSASSGKRPGIRKTEPENSVSEGKKRQVQWIERTSPLRGGNLNPSSSFNPTHEQDPTGPGYAGPSVPRAADVPLLPSHSRIGNASPVGMRNSSASTATTTGDNAVSTENSLGGHSSFCSDNSRDVSAPPSMAPSRQSSRDDADSSHEYLSAASRSATPSPSPAQPLPPEGSRRPPVFTAARRGVYGPTDVGAGTGGFRRACPPLPGALERHDSREFKEQTEWRAELRLVRQELTTSQVANTQLSRDLDIAHKCLDELRQRLRDAGLNDAVDSELSHRDRVTPSPSPTEMSPTMRLSRRVTMRHSEQTPTPTRSGSTASRRRMVSGGSFVKTLRMQIASLRSSASPIPRSSASPNPLSSPCPNQLSSPCPRE